MKTSLARIVSVLAACIAVLLLAGCAPAVVAKNTVIQMAYKATLADGTVFSQSEEGKPLEALVGGGFLIPGLEKQMIGMKLGEKRTITVKAADAYGEADPSAIQTVPRARFPKDLDLKVGARYQLNLPAGSLSFIVTAINGQLVTVDFNNPLAGKDLTFDVTVVKIRPATKAELSAAANAAAPPPGTPAAPETPAAPSTPKQ
ncbi:MAG TPA: peptidylprolyl isomerase [Spirochaetia bacterium]|nr:peptidylprolyl isomerase [Spirochaetia bacterium]